MKQLLFITLLTITTGLQAQKTRTYLVSSPNGKVILTLQTGRNVVWSVKHEDTEVVMPSVISLVLEDGQVLGKNAVVENIETHTVDTRINTPFYKRLAVVDNYHELIIHFKKEYGLIIRAYDEGIAYRFFTRKKGDLTIMNEEANFNFSIGTQGFMPLVNDYRNKDKYTTSFEAHYQYMNLSAITEDSLAFLPIVVGIGGHKRAAVLEADLQDYPGMYLTAGVKQGLQARFARYPIEEATGGFHNMNYVVNKRAAYIAKTKGNRNFPWRVVLISSDDKQLADNDMVQKLSAPSKITDYSWIKPGKVAWDWWNDWNITHVDFKSGVNVPTYKYYIDFASANHLEYIIMDEGWSDTSDINKFNIDVQQLIDYGKQKNVGIILWASWYAISRQVDFLFGKFAKMGIMGFKIDFIDRDDQKMISSLYEIAGNAAEHHLVLDYHGMYKPSGIQRTFPNILNFEGVKGMENMKWGVDDQPGYDVSIPFIRMLSGPMDYTPGAMRNASRADFRPSNTNPVSQGTRCHQLAMYIVFEAPLTMLADNPTIYAKEQECLNFISAVPTTFDETVSLQGKIGEYVAIARKKGDTWYAGAMTNWSARDMTLDLSFLGAGWFMAEIFQDGVNAGKDATDYKRRSVKVSAKDQLTLGLSGGGGFAIKFVPLN